MDSNFPLFYKKLLEYFQELVNMHDGDQRRKFILWNTKEKRSKGKTLLWKTWFENGIYLVQNLLNEDKTLLILQYFQIISAIPSELQLQ